ncbi:MAG TPA: SHOCT domain-containing protein [Gaiellaceae bacterium]|nr:SHOCT domain-containing protein [Gaiellaceae bacterium]
MLAYTFGQVMWSMLVFFCWVLFFWLLFIVFADLFSRHDISGWGKAGWTIFVIVLPFIGILVYLIAEGDGMAERRMKEATADRAQTEAQIQAAVGGGGAAEQISKAKELLDSGAITQAEYDALKAKALAA